ncbi:MAG: redoxin domain-containing protein [Candidatus Obscuribacterales bacterium]|nr:redoxin domain-containing protein [Steroidobacteraceae bacterium]
MNRKAWKSNATALMVASAGLLLATQSQADSPTMVGDFGLIDHTGEMQHLSRLGNNKAVVVISQANSCADNVDNLPKYKLLRTTWGKQGVKVLMLNSSTSDNPESVRKHASLYDIDFPIMVDESQLVAESLGVTKAGEVLVIDPNTRQVLYRGPLDRSGRGDDGDDGSTRRRARPAASESGAPASARPAATPPPTPLADVLTKVVAGNYTPTSTVSVDVPKGCAYTFPVKQAHASKAPDYAKDVAPILKDKCAHCHVQGGIGPFAMNSYEIVRGFAPMIREVLMTKRMPPAQVDPHVRHFQNANYISNAELQTLVHWVDAGAPRGAAKADPMASVKPLESEWQLGKPDLIVEIPAYEVAATGVIDYFNHVIDLPFNEDKYVRAVQFIPGDKRVLHHLLSYVVSPTTDRNEVIDEANVRDFLEGYAPGKTDATQFPNGTGVFIPKGFKLTLQMHYTTMGKPVTDKTRVGLYFHKSPPTHKYLTQPISNGGQALSIPPGETEHRMNGAMTFKDDIMVYALRPHMHYRGKAFRFTVVYPDQTREVIMNVPNYNFAWQPTYRLSEPKLLPAGSRIITDGVFDNSKWNFANPDPTTPAVGGPQSWHEMFIGYVTYTLPSKPNTKQKVAAN